jgi:hypothetical protein
MAPNSQTKKQSAPKAISSSGQSAAKFTTQAANKAANATLAAVESSRNSAENMLRMSSDVVRDFFSAGTDETARMHEKIFSVGRETVEHLSRSAENASQSLNEAAAISRDNVEAIVELTGVATNISKEIGTEAFNYLNDVFSQNVELSKEAFACRTLSDLFELNNRMVKTNIDSFFNQSMRMSEMLFQYASEAAEPINERINEASERFSKALAA